MSQRWVKVGSADISVVIRIVDSVTGAPEEGVTAATAGLALWYRREGGAKTAISPVNLGSLTAAHTDGGLLHVDDGYYRLDLPDAAVAADAVGVMVGGTVTGMTVIGAYIQLMDSMAGLWRTRTLSQTAVQVAAVLAGDKITILRGDSLSVSLTGLGSLVGYVSLDFTVKENPQDADSAAIIRIRKNASGSGDGLLRFNGAAAGDATAGSITIDDQTNGDISVALTAAYTALLTPDVGLFYDVQLITASEVSTLTEGEVDVTADVTRAVS